MTSLLLPDTCLPLLTYASLTNFCLMTTQDLKWDGVNKYGMLALPQALKLDFRGPTFKEMEKKWRGGRE